MMITIRKIPATMEYLTRGSDEYNLALEALEYTDNETYRLLQQFPLAADKGGNYAFNTTLDDAFEPILVSEMLDDQGGQLTGLELIQAIGREMVKTDRSRSIHCSKSDIQLLTESSAWRLWSQLIDDEKELARAYHEVFGIELNQNKEVSELKKECAHKVKKLFL